MEIQEKAQVDQSQSDQHGQNTVTITIDNTKQTIHRGRQSVSEIKHIGGVAQADILNQIIEGKLVELQDDGAVTIKGGEEFISHPRNSTSS